MDENFDTFWAAFPRKVAKGDARKAWKQTESIRPAIDKVLSSIEYAKKTEQWQRDRGQFIPYPATWLRGERWDDCYEAEITAPDCDSATEAWHLLRQAIQRNQAPTGAIAKACSAIGGFHRLSEMTSFEIGQRQKAFESAYRNGGN